MDIPKLLQELTLEEKAALCQGKDFWHLVSVPRLGIPSIMVSDGPHGLRKQDQKADHLGVNDSIVAVCMPTGSASTCSFDRDMLEDLGAQIGQSAQAEDLAVVLGPAANIKRSPLCGRNFEYLSEDPYLSGEMAAAVIRGVQGQGVGTSLKHFAANNQETRRMSVSVRASERAMREIYLASFEGAVRGGKPWTVMCSYNKIDGVYSSENPWLLTSVLRDDWGFDGLVMTDWSACSDHVAGIESGLELEMPRAGDFDDQAVIDAVNSGRLSMEDLDRAVSRVLQLIDRYQTNHRSGEVFDRAAQHEKARSFARESMVLLKNEGGILPLDPAKKIAFIGKFADKPRFQGGGSSHIRVSAVTSALEASAAYANVTYAQGYDTKADVIDEALQAQAVAAAAEADVAVLFLGLPDAFESEGYDREHLDMPKCQTALLNAVAAVQKNIVVVLHNGAPIVMPWIDKAAAVLEAYLGGQAGGGAVADVLFGAANPCGKLAETFPLRLEDTPCYLNFPGDGDEVVYAEDIWVGYRYYDKKKLPVLFPFGHGLSYTTFSYGPVTLSASTFAGGKLTASVDVTNTGSIAGKETVQFYVAPTHVGKNRPIRELKGFAKVALQPGETKTVSVTLDERSFSYWETDIHEWYMEPGTYAVEAAASSRDIRSAAEVTVENAPLKVFVTPDTILGDVMKIPGWRNALGAISKAVENAGVTTASDNLGEGNMSEMMNYFMPLHGFVSFADGMITRDDAAQTADALNAIQE